MEKKGYSSLWKAIIRPDRQIYDIGDLGPEKFTICGRGYTRKDITIENERALKLRCSHFEPFESERSSNELPCVIFLHGNASSRLEVLPYLTYFLPMGITVFCFDFSGSGLSDGKYISLGFYERDDLKCVIMYLRASKRVSSIALWGRSMGAVTALMHSHRDSTIAGMVLDSPLSDLNVLAMELAKAHSKAPKLFIKIVLSLIKGSIKSRAKFSIDDISPIKFVSKSFIPCYFLYGLYDTFITPHHSVDIYNAYAGEKQIFECNGDHFTARPKEVLDPICIFIYNVLHAELVQMKSTFSSPHKNLMDLETALQIIKIKKSNEDEAIKNVLIDSLLCNKPSKSP